jgi:hypothetical protein
LWPYKLKIRTVALCQNEEKSFFLAAVTSWNTFANKELIPSRPVIKGLPPPLKP